MKDALIAEGGVPGADEGYAIAYLYEVDDEGTYTFESEAAYIGEAPNFMAALKEPVAYADDEIDERYRDEEADAEGDESKRTMPKRPRKSLTRWKRPKRSWKTPSNPRRAARFSPVHGSRPHPQPYSPEFSAFSVEKSAIVRV